MFAHWDAETTLRGAPYGTSRVGGALNLSRFIFVLVSQVPLHAQLCRAGEDVPAIFSYAAVFAGGDPVQTGNLLEPEVDDDNPAIENNGRQ